MYRKPILYAFLMVYLKQEVLTENTASFVALVKESGHSYRELISINLDANVVQYSNPSHRSSLGTRNIQDFKLGIQMICFPSERRCFILQLNEDIYPNAQELLRSLADTYNENGKLMYGKGSVEFIEKLYMTGKIFHDLTKFGPVIRSFHVKYGYPVYEVKKLPVNPQTLIDDRKNTLRRRRDSIRQACVVNGKQVSHQYMYTSTSTNGCDWLTVCKNDRCQKLHVRNRLFVVCICCPFHRRASECLSCQRI